MTSHLCGKNTFGYKDQSNLRKILQHDELEAGNSLGYSMSNVLWHGDYDVHMGNFVHVEKNDGTQKFIKIDHGFSFFNFKEEVTDVYTSPLKGKIMSISPTRKLKNKGSLIEVYGYNKFWSLAAEKKRFYYSGPFIKGCEDIAALKEEEIRNNIHESLTKVVEIYQPNSIKALQSFGERLGISKNEMLKEVKGISSNNQTDILVANIEEILVKQMIKRQKSMENIANHCRQQASLLTFGHHKLSRKIDAQIIKLLDKIAENEKILEQWKIARSQNKKKDDKQIDYVEKSADLLIENRALEKEINFLKMLEQANDLACLTVSQSDNLELNSEFNFFNMGTKKTIKNSDFKEKLEEMQKPSKVHGYDKPQLSDGTKQLIEDLKYGLKELKAEKVEAHKEHKRRSSMKSK